MPKENFGETLDRLRVVAQAHEEYLRENEMRTRIVMIDPILLALGWDVRDPDRVRLEARANGNRADYVLLNENGAPLAITEAKKWGHWPSDARLQASGYAVEIGVRYVILTNGNRWEAWEVREGKRRTDAKITELNLSTGTAEQIEGWFAPLQQGSLGQEISNGRL